MTVSGSSSRNLFRTVAIVEESYPDKSTPITSVRKQTSKYQIGTVSAYEVTYISRLCQNHSVEIYK